MIKGSIWATPTEITNSHVSSQTAVSRNLFWLVLSTLVTLPALILQNAIIARYLGVEEYGHFALILGSGAISFGILQAVGAGVIARASAQGGSAFTSVFPVALYSQAFLGALALIATLSLVGIVSVGTSLLPATLLWGAAQWFALVGATPVVVLGGQNRMEWHILLSLAYWFNLVLLLFVRLTSWRLVGVTVALLLPQVVISLATWSYMVRRHGFSILHTTRSRVVTILKEMATLGIANVAGSIHGYAGTFGLQILRDAVQVGLYGASLKALEYLRQGPRLLLPATLPTFSSLAGQRDLARLGQFSEATFRYMFVFGTLLSGLGFGLARLIVAVLFGPEFHDAISVLSLASLTLLPTCLHWNCQNTLIAFGKHQDMAKIYLTGAAVQVALDIMLIPTSGAIGAAIAYLVGDWVIFALFAIAMYRLQALPGIEFWFKCVFTYGSIMIPMLIVGIVLSLPLVAIVLGLCTFLMTAFKVKLLTQEDLTLTKHLVLSLFRSAQPRYSKGSDPS